MSWFGPFAPASRCERPGEFVEQLSAMSTDHPDTASVTIVALGYRAPCSEAGCGNLGRLILRYADSGGRPMLDNPLAPETGTVCHM
jgi:hypothetical protein